MASIYPRGDILWIKYKFQGKLYRKSTGYRNTKQGEELADIFRLQTEIDLKLKREDRLRPSGLVSLGAVYEDFILFKQGDNRRMDLYETAINHLIRFYGTDRIAITAIKLDRIKKFRQYLLDKNFSVHTVFTYFVHIRTFFSYCVEQGYISTNPVPKLKKSTVEKRVIPEDMMHRLLWYFKLHDKKQYEFIKLLYLTGFRKGELLSLRGEDIDLKRRLIFVNNTKGNRIDKFPIDDALFNFIQTIKISKGRVVAYSVNGLRFWNRAIKRMGLTHYSLHDIRRLYATRMAHRLQPYELNKLLRHKDMNTTLKHYADVELDKIVTKMNN
ncbi:hypothetical protein LCGC14_2773400 [marine sediment metagenome]|uniref:Tyr recombinase domain-containing protein n=1 Tax=marine sediment metagenome TaxID=412755 RepID=A0A0F8YVH2_9ZZZZ